MDAHERKVITRAKIVWKMNGLKTLSGKCSSNDTWLNRNKTEAMKEEQKLPKFGMLCKRRDTQTTIFSRPQWKFFLILIINFHDDGFYFWLFHPSCLWLFVFVFVFSAFLTSIDGFDKVTFKALKHTLWCLFATEINMIWDCG